jgi:hypothetical protein
VLDRTATSMGATNCAAGSAAAATEIAARKALQAIGALDPAAQDLLGVGDIERIGQGGTALNASARPGGADARALPSCMVLPHRGAAVQLATAWPRPRHGLLPALMHTAALLRDGVIAPGHDAARRAPNASTDRRYWSWRRGGAPGSQLDSVTTAYGFSSGEPRQAARPLWWRAKSECQRYITPSSSLRTVYRGATAHWPRTRTLRIADR